MEANFALDANAGSASPKGWQAAAKRGLIANNPFSRSKKEDAAKRLFFVLLSGARRYPGTGPGQALAGV